MAHATPLGERRTENWTGAPHSEAVSYVHSAPGAIRICLPDAFSRRFPKERQSAFPIHRKRSRNREL